MRGGARKNAGRKKGSRDLDRPRIRDFITEGEVKQLVKKCKELANEGRPELMKFLLEQIFGKAVQPIGNEDNEPFKIAGVEVIVRNNGR